MREETKRLLRVYLYKACMELKKGWRVLDDGDETRKEIADMIVDLQESIIILNKELLKGGESNDRNR